SAYFAVDLDILFAREGVALAVVHHARIAEQAAEDFGQEIVQELMFLKLIGLARGEQLGPARQCGPVRLHALRQRERGQVRPQNIGTKQRLGFDGQGHSRKRVDESLENRSVNCKRDSAELPETLERSGTGGLRDREVVQLLVDDLGLFALSWTWDSRTWINGFTKWKRDSEGRPTDDAALISL